MSQENVERMRAFFEAWRGGDSERQTALMREYLHPEFELHPLYFDRVYEGVAGMQEFFSDMRNTWEDYVLDLQEIVDLGERVVVVLRMSARGAGSGVPVAQELGVVYTFRGQKAIRAKAFASRADAFEAAGLRE
jgi:ketosteroid isomerase-like protein